MTNPFAQQQPAAPAANPFGQPQQANPAAPQTAPNPFGQGVPQAAPAAPAPAAAPAQQQWPAQQAPAQTAPSQWNAPQQAQATPSIDLNRLAGAGEPVVGGASGAKLADMYSRLVVIFPLSIGMQARSPQYITDEQRRNGNTEQERLVATVVVLDSGPGTPPGTGFIDFGGNPHALGGKPHDKRESLPYVRKAMWITQSRLISQCRDFLPREPGAGPGVVVGRLAKTGPEANAPWYLVTPSQEEIDTARKYLDLVHNNQYPHPLAP